MTAGQPDAFLTGRGDMRDPFLHAMGGKHFANERWSMAAGMEGTQAFT